MLKRIFLITFLVFLFFVDVSAQEPKHKYHLPLLHKDCNVNAILEITDGTTTIDLLDTTSGLFLEDWTPAIAQLKGGGTYQSSNISPESQLIQGVFENTEETFNFTIRNRDQDSLIRKLQNLLRLLEKARSYWTTEYQNEPVYIVAKSGCETNTRYAIIKNYQFGSITNPYAQPFASPYEMSAMDGLTLILERGHWLSNIPGTDEIIEINNSQFLYSDFNFEVTDMGATDSILSLMQTSVGTIYAGEKDSGNIWYSTDDGINWSLSTSSPTDDVLSLFEAGGYIFAGSDEIWRSGDNGSSWQVVLADASVANFIYDFVQLNNGYIIATGQNEIWRSTNNGTNWAKTVINGTARGVVQLTDGTIYVAASENLYKSTDNGENWILIQTFVEHSFRTMYLADNGYIYLSDTQGWRLYRSIDGGNSWQVVLQGPTSNPTLIQITDLTEDENGVIYGVNQDGIKYSLDNGNTWFTYSEAFLYSEKILYTKNGTFLGMGYSGGTGKVERSPRLTTLIGGEGTEVYVNNKHINTQLNYIKIDDGGSFTDIFPIDSYPKLLLPSTPAVNDAIYFGISTDNRDEAPFSGLVFDIDTIAYPSDALTSLTWEYYNGASWAVLEVTDSTNSFRISGVHAVTWEIPSDWSTTTVDGVEAHWVRVRLSFLSGSITAPTQKNRNIYIINKSYVEITSTKILGDISALSRQKISNCSDADGTTGIIASGQHSGSNNASTMTDSGEDFISDGVTVGMYIKNTSDGSKALITGVTATTISGTLSGGTDNDWDTSDFYQITAGADLWTNRVIVGLRSYDRGVNFQSYLNASDEQDYFGITASTGTNTTFGNDVQAPTGRVATYNPTGVEAMASRITFSLVPSITRDFYGTFHTFLRVQRTAGASTDFNVQLKITSGSGGITKITETKQVQTTTKFEVLDFGQIKIPVSGLFTNVDLGDITTIEVQASAASGTPNLNIYDLILIPTDEWAIDNQDAANTDDSILGLSGDNKKYLDIDSTTNPKNKIQSSIKFNKSDVISSLWNSITPGEAILQSNTNQRLWFFAMQTSATGDDYAWIAPPEIVHSVQLFKNERYLGLRGNR